MRADVCLHRSAALIAAAEEDGLGDLSQGGTAIPANPLTALFSQAVPTRTELPSGRIRFDPVRVYIGPAPGWNGPILGAAQPAGASQSADVAPPARHGPKRRLRTKVRHHSASVTSRAQKLWPAKTRQSKLDNSDNIKQDPSAH